MKTISSRENPRYKALRQLAQDPRVRKKAGQTLLDGVHLCQAYLEQVGLPLACIFSDTGLQNQEAAAVVERCDAAGGECVRLPDLLYRPLSQVESGIGLSFVIEVPRPPERARLMRDAVILDRIQDPGNLGSILRSAAAAGFFDIFCNEGCATAWSPRVLRAGMGAHFQLRIHEGVELGVLLAHAEVPVYATSSHAQTTLWQLDLKESGAWLFGCEGQGVAPELLVLASRTVSIPHAGLMESLNVAASAAICFFESVRQRNG